MNNAFSHELFRRLPLVGILRGFQSDQIRPIVEACLEGGLTNLEITMNTEGAADQIRTAVETAKGRMNIGAGTVTSRERLVRAVEAGATYVVTPAVIPDVIDHCRELGLPFIPGAFTPTEVWQAWDSGATMVKLFPADLGGPAYVKSLKGPYPEIPIMATGGVSLESIGDYLKAGTDGFGLGGPLFKRDRVDAGDWEWIAEQVRKHRGIHDAFHRERES
jgi:2-dehydro-3-deoxyphosphogluconate aldolase/(4S)-4-hydroxy-2-oxoglutarate aldolase